jgi:hypothetical protein
MVELERYKQLTVDKVIARPFMTGKTVLNKEN